MDGVGGLIGLIVCYRFAYGHLGAGWASGNLASSTTDVALFYNALQNFNLITVSFSRLAFTFFTSSAALVAKLQRFYFAARSFLIPSFDVE